jgi:pyruvate/2-oxoglutarate dehydrogenase complex dihydrolipoamide acyltransferase (E2) component
VRGLPVPAHVAGASYMSPRMKARMDELGLHAASMAGIAGSGAAGRVTIEDLEKYLANLERQKLTEASTMRVAVADKGHDPHESDQNFVTIQARDRVVQTRYFSVEGFATNRMKCVGVAAGQFAREIAQVFAPRV